MIGSAVPCRVRETLDVGRELDTQMKERHGPNIGVQAFLTRTDLLSLVLLSGLWISMSALVNPIGDFPLNDDWVYAYGVRSIVQGGRFELPGTGAPDVIAQAYWGALFCMPFGFSFTALRFSTLTLGWAGLIAFYLLIQEVAGNRWLALLGGLALATNPIYFGLAHTFMTEVPFVSLVIIALWLFVRGLKRNASVPLLAGIVITLIAILVRQFALLLLLAFGVAYLVKNGVKWKTLAVAIIPLAFGAGVHVAYQHWMIVTGRKPYFELATLSDLIPIPFVTFILYSLRIPASLPYLGFFLAPFLASVLFVAGPPPRHRRIVICALMSLAGLLLAGIYVTYGPIPEIGHILTPSGLGPRSLRDTFVLRKNFPPISPIMATFWICSIAIGSFGAAALIMYFVRGVARVVTGLHKDMVWLESLTLVFVCAYAISLLLMGFGLKTPLFDRYLLVFVPPLFILALIIEVRAGCISEPRWRGALSLGLIFIYAGVSVAATHDYLAWNRMRWMATRMLMESGISPTQIDGGYEFNGWYLSDPNYKRKANKSWWWVNDDEYVIASGPLSGYQELQRFVFQRWFLFGNASVVILHRVGAT